MKKKVFLCLVFVLVLVLSLSLFAACGKDKNDGNGTQTETAPSIADIVTTGKPSTEYTVEGVVFGKASDGFLISDGNNSIFVESTENVAVGDKVKVKGTLKINAEKAPVLGTATVTVSANGQQAITATVGALSDLTNLAASRKNFYKFYEVVGFVRYDADTATYTLESGTSKVIINTNGKANDFAELVDAKVKISFINTGFTSAWKVLYFGGVAKYEVNLGNVKDTIFGYVTDNTLAETYIALDLPAKYDDEPDVTFAWSVVTADAPITITDNKATVKEVTEDTAVELKLTLTAPGEQTAEKIYNVTVKKAAQLALADVAASAETGVIVFSGTVYAKSFSSAGDRFALLVSDGNNNYVAVDVDKVAYLSYKVGDEVKVSGNKAVVVDVNTVVANSVLVTAAAPADFKIDFSKLTATELKNSDPTSYTGLVDNYLGNTNRLYKITTPYMVSSGNTSSNFIRFGYDSKAGSGYNSTDGKVRYFCFTRAAMDESVDWLQNELDVPNLADGGKEYAGYTFYAFAMFSSSQTWQFVLSGDYAVEIDKTILSNNELTDAMAPYDTIIAKEAGVIVLPSTLKYTGDIVWSQDKEVFDLATGAYAAATANTVVKLTATYTLDGVEKTKVFALSILMNEPEFISVSEALALTTEDYIYTKGTVVGLVPSHSGSGKTVGLYISDGKKIAAVNVGGQIAVGADNQSIYVDTHEVKVGDSINFAKVKISNNAITADEFSNITFGTSVDVTGSWFAPATADVTTINNGTELAAYMATIDTLGSTSKRDISIVKIVATADNPIYFGGVQKYFMAFSYLTPDTLASITKTDFCYALGDSASTLGYYGTHVGSMKYAVGDEWMLANTPVTALGAYADWKMTYPAAETPANTFKYTGSFYVVFEYMGTSKFPYAYSGIIGAGFDLTKVAA